MSINSHLYKAPDPFLISYFTEILYYTIYTVRKISLKIVYIFLNTYNSICPCPTLQNMAFSTELIDKVEFCVS